MLAATAVLGEAGGAAGAMAVAGRLVGGADTGAVGAARGVLLHAARNTGNAVAAIRT